MVTDIIIYRDHGMALHAHAMAEAFFNSGLAACVSDYMFYDIHNRTGLMFLLDPTLPLAPPVQQAGRRLHHIYSAKYAMTQARLIAKWHEAHDTPGFFEATSPHFEGIPGLQPLLLPPLPLIDNNIANPLRQEREEKRVCIPLFPVSDQLARRVQKEYLRGTAEAFFLTFLEPAKDHCDLTERFFAFSSFYLPVEGEGQLWNFDLACLLTAGATITGAVPSFFESRCPHVGSLDEAARQGGQPKQIMTDMQLLKMIQKHFVRTVTADTNLL